MIQPEQPDEGLTKTVLHLLGLDLHSNNVVAVMIDDSERWVLKRKFLTNLPDILSALEPYKDTIFEIGVEATYNWYWLVDGLMEAGYKVRLAHPAKLEGYSGKKRTNDYHDAFHIAHLLRIKNFPDAYIYPREYRPLRDLMRKRSVLVKTKTKHMVSFINSVNRNLGIKIGSNKVKQLSDEDVEDLLDHEYLVLSGKADISVVRHIQEEILILEKTIVKEARLKPEFKILLGIPGIGKVLALTIVFEMGTIARFSDAGNYLSYCRCVDSKKLTNGKKKGENNRKSGNGYLCWAYVEAANFAKRYCPYARVYYKHKLKETGHHVIATKALASKIARASYHVLKTGEIYDPEKVFVRYKAQAQALLSQKEKEEKQKEKGCGSKARKVTGSQPSV